MVIVTRRVDLLRAGRLVAAVGSTDFTEPLEPIKVRRPSHPEGQSVTRLSQDIVAVCDWVVESAASDIRETGSWCQPICSEKSAVWPG